MTPAALRERMRFAVAAHVPAAPAPTPEGRRPERLRAPIDRILGGEWRETSQGPVFVKEAWFPLEHRHGTEALGAVLSATPESLGTLLGGAAAPHPSRLAFLDIETTGLSTGAGTYMILAGLGAFDSEADAFRLRQYFLADVACERSMLALVAADLAGCEGVVTYNGRAFDMPFVQTRMTLARLHCPSHERAHFDLLHAVRRLYAHRMPGCRLAEAERRLLRIERFDDIAGSLIPSLYFDYVRAGRASPLRAVFRHNADDVLSLAGILAAVARLFDRGDLDPEDAVAVARWWELAREPARAAPLYRTALPWLEGGDDWRWAAARHAMVCKRTGEREEAAGFWRRLWEEEGDRRAGLELAMHREHYARDLPAAEEVARALLVRCADHERIGLGHRLARIRRKLQLRHSRAAGDATRGGDGAV